jgi:hypothetical protein
MTQAAVLSVAATATTVLLMSLEVPAREFQELPTTSLYRKPIAGTLEQYLLINFLLLFSCLVDIKILLLLGALSMQISKQL